MAVMFVGDVGTKIVLDVGCDISSATVKQIKYRKPDGTSGAWDANVEDSTKLYYVTQDGDIDQAGTWLLQAYVELPTWKGYGEIVELYVHQPL